MTPLDFFHGLLSQGISYLLHDLFSTDESAPITSPHLALPGPGTALVRDVESKIAVASGWVNFTAQATPAYADQDLVFSVPALVRQTGRIVACKYKLTTDGSHYPLALVDSTTPAWNHTNVQHGFYRSGALTLSTVDNGAAGQVLTAIALDTEYWLALIPQTTGCYYLIKGGVFTNWHYLQIPTVGTGTPLYEAAAGYDAAFSLAKIKSPTQLYSGADYIAGS